MSPCFCEKPVKKYSETTCTLCWTCENCGQFGGCDNKLDYHNPQGYGTVIYDINVDPAMKIKLKKLTKEAKIPTYGTKDSAAVDLYAVEDVTWFPGDVKFVRSGWILEIPEGYYCDIRPRSGLACRKQMIILNSPCTIDSDYRGELFTYMKNLGDTILTIRKGDRYAQMLLQKKINIEFEEIEELTETDRGDGGVGHTGQ
jgi:dUTP pyrophosphatase